MRKELVAAITVAGLVFACSATAKPKTKAGGGSGSGSPPPAAADGDWSLQDKQYWQKLQEEMDEAVKKVNTACGGTHIKGGFDKESFRGRLTEGGSYGMNMYARAHCLAAPSALQDICTNSDMGKSAVGQKVTTYECKWGGKGKQAMHFASGRLVTTIDIDGEDNAASFTTKVEDYMKSKL
jgi:hypothetical protein